MVTHPDFQLPADGPELEYPVDAYDYDDNPFLDDTVEILFSELTEEEATDELYNRG